MTTKMRGLADEIADRLIQELRNRAAEESSYEEGPGQEKADEAAENGPEKENRFLPVVSQEMSPGYKFPALAQRRKFVTG